MEERNGTLLLENRSRLEISGVLEMIEYGETALEAETTLGRIQVTGEKMHMEKLDLEKGNLILTGRIDSVYYPGDKTDEHRFFLSRLFS